MKKRIWRVLTIALAIVGCLAILLLVSNSPHGEVSRKGNTISLKAPSFISVASADTAKQAVTGIIEAEAGISAYFNAATTINLADVRGVFRTIEAETADYIIGSAGSEL